MNRFSDAYMLWAQWSAVPREVRELTIQFVDFVDARWFRILGDNAGVMLHVDGNGESAHQYDWRFGWLID